jgi:putative FmdB family regulatory protein
MPAYDYLCAACGRRFEVVHGVYADSPTACPLCGKGPVRKAISAPAIHYKGSGWAKKERRATVSPGGSKATSEDSSPADTSSTPETAAADTPAPAPAKTVETGTAKTTD